MRVGGRLMVTMDNGALEMLVVGIIKHRDDAGIVLRDRMALVPLTTLQDALGLRRQLARIRLSLQPGRDLVRTETTLARALTEHPLVQSSAVVVSKADASNSTFTLYGIMMSGLALAGAVTLWAAASSAPATTVLDRPIQHLACVGRDVFRARDRAADAAHARRLGFHQADARQVY